MNRRIIIRIVFVLLLILLGVWMFFIGKQHTLLLDNQTVDDIRALDLVYVQVDNQPELELVRRMRDQALVTGQSHTVRITYTDSSWNEVTIEKDIHIPLNESMMLLSVPVLLSDPDAPQEEWLTHFESLAVTVEDDSDDEVVLDENASLTSF